MDMTDKRASQGVENLDIANPVADGQHEIKNANTVVEAGMVGAIAQMVAASGGQARGKVMKKIRLRTLSGKYVEPVQTIRRSGPKVGRNDKCPCGSGLKNKRCCLPKLEAIKADVRAAAERKRAELAQAKK